MNYKTIGQATRGGQLPAEHGVSFELSYGDHSYDIFLGSEELNEMLLSGVKRVVENRSVGYGYGVIWLESPDLPLFVSPRTVDITPRESGSHLVSMVVGIVTMSNVDEQRGLLRVARDILGEWEYVNYERQPDLQPDPLHTVR